MARVVNPRNAAACLILAGYEVARDRQTGAANFLKWTPRPLAEVLADVPDDGCKLIVEENARRMLNFPRVSADRPALASV